MPDDPKFDPKLLGQASKAALPFWKTGGIVGKIVIGIVAIAAIAAIAEYVHSRKETPTQEQSFVSNNIPRQVDPGTGNHQFQLNNAGSVGKQFNILDSTNVRVDASTTTPRRRAAFRSVNSAVTSSNSTNE